MLRPLPILTLVFALISAAHSLVAATPIPFEPSNGMIWLKVAVAGHSEPLHFLLDSGAGATVLDLSTARRLGVPLGTRENVQGVHGRSTAYRVDGLAAQVGGVAIPGSLLAVDLSGPSRACHRHIDGLLGADFFRQRIVQIDFAAHTLRLLQREELNETGSEVLPLATRNDAFCTRVSINGNPPEWLRLDTGCNTALEWVVTGGKAKKMGIPTLGLNTGSVRETRTQVQLGTLQVPDVCTGLHTSQMFAGESGLVGNALLSRFRVTVDAAKSRLILAPARR